MKSNIVKFLQASFPFLVTIALWRLSGPWWNPAGILAIIPVFFCTFIRPVNWFAPFGFLMCMLIDYKFETVCFWMAWFCMFYAINSFQTFIDISRMDKDAIVAFILFFGVGLLIQLFSDFTFLNLAKGLWVFIWTCAWYLPINMVIKKVHK